MTAPELRILQVNTFDLAGGAERVSWNLFNEYRHRGYASWLVVGRRRSDDPDIFRMPHDRGGGLWSRLWWSAHLRLQPWYLRNPLVRLLCRLTHALAAPRGIVDRSRGRHDFNYPGAWHLLELTPLPANIIHCHNLHGKYFDLRALCALSRQVPLFVTLHDEWLYTGNCVHSFDCMRWQSGCRDCPQAQRALLPGGDPAAFNWQRKRSIFLRCNLYVGAPSAWLLERARRSILAPAVVEARVIPNGVDLGVFRPADRPAVRNAVGLPPDAHVILLAANGIRHNPYKDYTTFRTALAILSDRMRQRRIIAVALGEKGPAAVLGSCRLEFVPFTHDVRTVALYYQAADLYVHAARADTFPNSVLEALACGTPVVATGVGGICEQVRSLALDGAPSGPACATVEAGATGVLVPPADPDHLARAVQTLLENVRLRQVLGENARRDAVARFDLRQQADAYLNWYAEVLSGSRSARATAGAFASAAIAARSRCG